MEVRKHTDNPMGRSRKLSAQCSTASSSHDKWATFFSLTSMSAK
jgi:hypothetical protein